MADYHILRGSADGNSLTVVFHVPIPDQNNTAGINLRTALSELNGGSVESVLPSNRLGTGEQAALDAGALYEHVFEYHTRPGMDAAEKQAELDQRYSNLSTGIANQVANQLEYWGYGRDVS